MKKLLTHFSLAILLVLIGNANNLFGHSVQVAYGIGCGGTFRLYIEHWHGTANPSTTTMTLQLTVGSTTSTITSSPGGSFINTPLASMPTTATVVAGCPGQVNTYDDWVYYDFTVPCCTPFSVTVISGNTVFTEDGCGMYPLVINSIIPCLNPITAPNQTVCAGTPIAATNFPAPLCGAIYSWSNSNPSIGLGASGTGNIGSFTAVNNTTTPQVATVSVLTNGCPTASTFTLTVDPKPQIVVTDPPVVCLPNTVDITAATVTAGSTNMGPITYWTNAAATNSLSNPSAINTSGTYYIVSSLSAGCSDTMPVNVVIDSLPVLAITNPLVVCVPNTVDITAAAITLGTTGTGVLSYWNDAAATSALANPSAIAVSGTYYIQITTSAGCKDIKPVTVIINPLPVLYITNPLTVCSPNTVDITLATVTVGSTGAGVLSYWMDAAATVSLTNPSAIATSGTYYIQSMGIGGCNDIKPVTVTINPKPVLTITNPPAICFPGTIDITGAAITAGTTGVGVLTYWNNSTATSALVSPNAISVSGTYYIQITTVNGCTDIQPVIVSVNPLPVLSITSPAAVCFPSTVDITLPIVTAGSVGTGTLTYWQDAAATIVLVNPTAIAVSGVYYIKMINSSGCSDIKPVSVTINAKPVVSFSVDVPRGCPVHCVNFTDLSSIASGNSITSWAWDFGDGQISTLQNPAHCYSSPGFYDVTLTVVSNRGCSETNMVASMIEVYPTPKAAFDSSPDNASVINPTISFINQSSSDVVAWYWNFGDSTTLSYTNPNPVHAFPNVADVSYTTQLIVVNSYGCRDTVEYDIFIGPEFTFFIPNAFTPNGDGINDDFFGQGIGIVDYDMWIYDRWGNMIFHGGEVSDKWDGRANYGKEAAQQDVYVWKVALKDVFNKKHSYMGTVTLIR